MCEAFISSVAEVREGRRGGAREFYITGDLNVELELMCTDEKDIEELNGMYGRCVGKGTKETMVVSRSCDVVWNHEGVQLKGYLHVVQERPRLRDGFHDTTWRKENGRRSWTPRQSPTMPTTIMA